MRAEVQFGPHGNSLHNRRRRVSSTAFDKRVLSKQPPQFPQNWRVSLKEESHSHPKELAEDWHLELRGNRAPGS
jgi:hypothetical protein